MRIAMVTDSYFPSRDGVVTVISLLEKGLRAQGHEVIIVAPDPGPEHRMEGVRYFKARKFGSYDGYYVPLFPSNKIEILQDINPDVIHIHGIAVMALKALISSRTLKIPAVITFHTMVNDAIEYYSPVKLPPESYEVLVWKYLRNLLKRPYAVIAPSDAAATALLENGVKPKRLEVISMGVDTSRFSPDSPKVDEIRERHKLEGKKVIISVSRVSFEKRIEVPLEAMKEMPDDCVLVIVGKGPALESLKTQTEEMGLNDKVVFAGFVSDEDLPSYIAMADVAVSASEFETQGLALLEGMASGVPAACARAQGYKELVIDGFNGHFFDVNSSACAEAMKKCIENHDELSANALSYAKEKSYMKSVEKTLTLYEDAIGGV